MKCPLNKCNGSGFILRTDETGEEEFLPCDCRKIKDEEKIIHSKLVGACVPAPFWDYSLDNYLSLPFKPEHKKFNQSSVDKIKSCIDNPKLFLDSMNVLWIWGPDPNACHTTLAVMLGTELLKIGQHVRFLSMQTLINMLVDFEEGNDRFKKLDSYNAYIIDDAFDSKRCSLNVNTSAYTRAQLFNFFNESLNQNKHFICTSCIPLMSIDNQFSEIRLILQRSYMDLELRGSIQKLTPTSTRSNLIS
jgi:hypothetical protein